MKKITAAIYYVLSAHILALLFMSLQRIVLFLTNLDHVSSVEKKLEWIFTALLRGVWFDNVIASYITIVPLIIILLLALFNKSQRVIFRIFNVYYILLYTIVFAIGIADIPYFNYFFKHLNTSVFNWTEEGGTAAAMVLQELSYYIYMLFFIIAIIFFGYSLYRIRKLLLLKPQKNLSPKQYLIYIPLYCILIGLCFIGIRGRLGYNPIKTSQAYFCDNSFFNQLGLNPAFFFMRDMIESSKSHYNVDKLITLEQAIPVVRRSLGLDGTFDNNLSPIIRVIEQKGDPKNMNVIVILMESMSADLLNAKENGREITPFLNELKAKSYSFDNFYSAGTHTNHGIVATLYGIPALFDRNMMKNVNIPLCQGIPTTLQEQGYTTMFFMPHEAQYDNMNAFLLENGIQEIYSEENYPSSKCVNSFGVADDYLFEFALSKMREKATIGNPFFATILTVSNHPPYVVPDQFKAVSKNPQYQIVAFADDALKQFMTEAEKHEWAKNTLFVLLGDHGKIVGSQTYEMPLSYNHIPLIIYSPAFTDSPKQVEALGGQIDVFPTVMGLLNRSYVNNTFGINLFDTKRDYIYFSSDDGLGCIDHKFFYTYNFKSNISSLYKYRDNNPENFALSYPPFVDTMRTHAAAMFKLTDYMIVNKLLRAK